MRIFCGGAQCGHLLGEIGASVVGRNPNPVWRIQPGWRWRTGILERNDESLEQERRLAHETFGVQRISDGRVAIGREVNLPVVVRCPNCHRLRYVQPDTLLRPTLLRA